MAGFDPLAVPLALFDGERTWLFRHPSPPLGFEPAEISLTGAAVMAGRHDAVSANTNAEIAGVGTATVMLEGAAQRRAPEDVAAMAIHEAFHVFQRARHPGWTGNEVVLFTYPVGDAELLALRRLEFESLRRALAAGTWHDAACRASFERDDRQVLDRALEMALGTGARCELEPAVVAAGRSRARADVAALDSVRTARRHAFEQAAGWRVEVVATGEPLWPQGFDPLNVDRLGGADVLHGRYVKLGNGAGQLEALGTATITEGAGAHPLFDGVRRAVLTGLDEPDVHDAGGVVTIRARGLTAEFRGARIERDGTAWHVRVGD